MLETDLYCNLLVVKSNSRNDRPWTAVSNQVTPCLSVIPKSNQNMLDHGTLGHFDADLYRAPGGRAAPDEMPEVWRKDALQDSLLLLPGRGGRTATADDTRG